MVQVCYRCKKPYGEKAPLADRRISHGLCPPCIPLEWARIEKELRVVDKSPIGNQTVRAIRESPLQGKTR